jgi:hypothetical protein
MEREGPMLETLLQRLANTPEEFLGEPHLGNKGTVHVPAVVADLCRSVGVPLTAAALTDFSHGATRNSLSVSLLLCWLVLDDGLRSALLSEGTLFKLLNEGARELAEHTAARKFLTQSERREELARFTLARLSLRPAGETQAQAEDRLTSLSAAERARVLKAAREAEARARAVREALARKAAEESADKWTRE